MTFAVLGLGPSIAEYKPTPGVTSIGVNDVWKHVFTDHLLCSDPMRVFTDARIKTITGSKPQTFFSNHAEWGDYFLKPGQFRLLKFQGPRGSLMKMDDLTKIPYSICSPYVACLLAMRMGATEIIMYGVDFTDHHSLSKPHKLAIIERDFRNLYHELQRRKVNLYVGTVKSFLSTFIPVKFLQY